jgi:hypothetical protein
VAICANSSGGLVPPSTYSRGSLKDLVAVSTIPEMTVVAPALIEIRQFRAQPA